MKVFGAYFKWAAKEADRLYFNIDNIKDHILQVKSVSGHLALNIMLVHRHPTNCTL